MNLPKATASSLAILGNFFLTCAISSGSYRSQKERLSEGSVLSLRERSWGAGLAIATERLRRQSTASPMSVRSVGRLELGRSSEPGSEKSDSSLSPESG